MYLFVTTLHVLFAFFSMDGFRVVKIDMVVKQVDIVITCTGMEQNILCLLLYREFKLV